MAHAENGIWCEAAMTMYPIPRGLSRACEGKAYLPVQGGRGLGSGGMANVSELPINFVTRNKPNALTGLHQKVCSGLTGSFLQSQGRKRYRKKGRA
jgi:hypothetical protein